MSSGTSDLWSSASSEKTSSAATGRAGAVGGENAFGFAGNGRPESSENVPLTSTGDTGGFTGAGDGFASTTSASTTSASTTSAGITSASTTSAGITSASI